MKILKMIEIMKKLIGNGKWDLVKQITETTGVGGNYVSEEIQIKVALKNLEKEQKI